MRKRPLGLVLIVGYKIFTATLFSLTAVTLLFAVKNYVGLETFSDELALTAKQQLIHWGVEKLLGFKPSTLRFGGIVAAIYAAVSILEAAGLWLQKAWAKWLVLALVGLSIPPEIFELAKGFSGIKALVFLLNVAIFLYFLQEIYRFHAQHRRSRLNR
ncbi:MAG: DUF2127 domain-containing protein [Thermosynechococcaceae cyanobacterium]